MKSDQKKDFWQQHIQDWGKSKLPQKTYCQQNNISFASFGYWRTRLNRLQKPTKKLVPVTLSRPSAVVVITLPMGVRMDVPAHALAEVLPVVFRANRETA
jgi:hypothetical protein